MDKFIVDGGTRLRGTVRVGGSKNAALPMMAASLLTDDPVQLDQVPQLSDIDHMKNLLSELGVKIQHNDHHLSMQVVDTAPVLAQYNLVRKMRASICALGPLLARRGRAEVSMPGGCNIGDRPVDLHLRGLAALGADIELKGGNIVASCDRLKGAEIFLGGPFGSTVTGTANIMMAACLARGTTVIESAACEPEITDLAVLLNTMGAHIKGQGSPRLIIEGVRQLGGATHTVIPDRIETGTFMAAAAVTNGELTVENAQLEHLMAFIDRLRAIGVCVDRSNGGVTVASSRYLKAVDVVTQPHPGFPTDLQAQLMVLLALADGNSIMTEKVFPDRFMHVAELGRMGAHLRKEGPTIIVQGVKRLIGAPVMASDLRASAALVLAALVAEGRSEILRVYHIDRGYERIERRLNGVGAKIRRVRE